MILFYLIGKERFIYKFRLFSIGVDRWILLIIMLLFVIGFDDEGNSLGRRIVGLEIWYELLTIDFLLLRFNKW